MSEEHREIPHGGSGCTRSGGGDGRAAKLLTGKDIQDGSIELKDLSKKARA